MTYQPRKPHIDGIAINPVLLEGFWDAAHIGVYFLFLRSTT